MNIYKKGNKPIDGNNFLNFADYVESENCKL